MKLIEPVFGAEEVDMVRQCLESKWVTQGPFVNHFEALLRARLNVAYAYACTSCTTGLHMAALALELGPGDEVIVPAFTWITTVNMVEYVGATPVFVDVDPNTYNIIPEQVDAAITPNTKAIVPVHLFGLAAPMQELLDLAKQYGVSVIEDAACALGTTYDDTPIGSIGDITCFSFHPRKAITTGEGGLVTTNSQRLADRLAVLRNHGAALQEPDPNRKSWEMAEFNELGYNYRLSDIQAAVGVAQMGRLDELLEERVRLAGVYNSLFSDIEEVVLPTVPEKCGHSYQSYVIRLRSGSKEQRNRLSESLEQQGIQTRPGTHAVHNLGYYKNKFAFTPEQFPNATLCEDATLALPLFHSMQEEDQRVVQQAIKEALSRL